MTLVGVGAIIGSGWLFASGLVASIAGPAGWISWLLGGIALLLLGLVFSYLGSFDGIDLLKSPCDQVLVALVSVGIYYWGGRTGLAEPIVDEDEVEEEETAEAVTTR